MDNIYCNSKAICDHDFAQNPVDIISDELICVDAVSSDNVNNCTFDVEIITDNQLNHICEEYNTGNYNFVFNSQVNNNYEKSNVNSRIDCNCNDKYDFNFAQNSDDDNNSSSAKSNGTGLSVANLNSCNIDAVNNSDDQIIPVCKETSKVNNKDEDEDVSESIKTRDTNKQSDTQPLFNHVIISNNLNVETILNQFKELIVKPQDIQSSYCKFINVASPNILTKPGFPNISEVNKEKGRREKGNSSSYCRLDSVWSEGNQSV